MSFMIDRTCQKAAFLLGTALMLGTGLVTSDVLNVYATEAVDPAAAAQPTDPAATADPNAATQPAVDPAVAQPWIPMRSHNRRIQTRPQTPMQRQIQRLQHSRLHRRSRR